MNQVLKSGEAYGKKMSWLKMRAFQGVVLAISFFTMVVSTWALEMKLDLETKFVPGGQSTCGMLLCREDGVYPRIDFLKRMEVFRQRKDSGSEVKVASISEQQPRVSRLWEGVKVEGTWAKQKAEITMFLVEEQDCRRTAFSCHVTAVDGFGVERLSVSSIGSSSPLAEEKPDGHDVLVPEGHARVSETSALQISAIIQQVHASLADSIRQLQGRVDDNSRMLENRLEDKLLRWTNIGATQLSVTQATRPGLTTCWNVNSLDQINESLTNSSKQLHSLEKSVTELQKSVKDINGSSHLVEENINSLKFFFVNTIENMQEESTNVSDTLGSAVIHSVQSSQTAILSQLENATSSEPSVLTSCVRNQLESPGLTSYQVVFPTDDSTPPYLCDTNTEGGGWVVIQRRSTGTVDFFQSWASYKTGFGSLDGDFWLGNERIHNLTSRQPHELLVTLEYKGAVNFARYSSFAIGDEASSYKLMLAGYSGTAGDSLLSHKDMAFSTHDRDNDLHRTSNCAVEYHGAWWYRSCQSSNLNGRWGDAKIGPRWAAFSGSQPVTFSEMKIRPLPS